MKFSLVLLLAAAFVLAGEYQISLPASTQVLRLFHCRIRFALRLFVCEYVSVFVYVSIKFSCNGDM